MTGSGTATISVNNGTAVNLTSGSSATTKTDVSFSGTVTSIVITKTSNDNSGMLIYGFEIDGKRLVDNGVSISSNSFYLKFADNSSASNLGTDSSGESNTWTVNNLSVASGADNDSLIDTPTNYTSASGNAGGNYATLNPLDFSSSGSPTLKNGNLDAEAGSGWQTVAATIGNLTSGRWYWEVKLGGGSGHRTGLSSVSRSEASSSQLMGTGDIAINSSDGRVYVDGTEVGTGAGSLSGKTVGIALNLDANSVSFYQNNSLVHTVSNLSSTASWTPVHATRFSVVDNLNFGARPFAYTPPTDHVSLCTTNLPDPTIGDGSTAMDVKTWSGDSTERAITGYNFSPDFVWIKTRSTSDEHVLSDIVRGAGKVMSSSANNKESDFADPGYWGHVSSFDSDGFTLDNGAGGYHRVNLSGRTYVGWAWDAGTSNTSNSVGSLNSSLYNQSERWRDALTSSNGFTSGYEAAKAFDGVFDSGGGSANQGGGGTLTFTPPEALTVTSLELECYNDVTLTLPDGSTQTITGTGGLNLYRTANIGSGFSFTGSNSITMSRSGGYVYFGRIKINGKELVDDDVTINGPSIASTVRANTSTGFSIVSYTGTGTAATIAHGLNAAPEFIIVKNRDTDRPWSVFHQSITNMNRGYLNLNLTNAFTGNYNGVWNATDPTSSLFSVGTDNESNNSGDDFIAYCWTPVEGFSSFGSYEGNGNANGPFVYTGFKPRFIMIKNIDNYGSGYDWFMFDTARDTYNVAENTLKSNLSGTEYDSDSLDILSNGFKIRATTNGINLNSHTHIYLAFAENPFRISRAA